MPITLSNPRALLLLIVAVPLIVLLHRASRHYLPPGRKLASLAIRLALTLAVVLALAEPRLARRLDRLDVVFLVDASDSVAADARTQSVEFLRSAIKSMGPLDRAGVVVFGQNALVELPMGQYKEIADLSSIPVTTHTDLANALRVGVALLPRDAGRRIVVLSDGNENLGSALDEVKLAAAAGIQVSVVPLPSPTGPRILVSSVETPPTIRKTDTFDMRVGIDSNVATQAQLRLFTDGKLTGQQTVQLKQGTNNFTFPQQPLDQGFHAFTAQLEAPQDPIAENKQASSYSTVVGPPRVLLLEGAPGEAKNLHDALQSTGTLVDVLAPSSMPADVAGLRTYDSVVLVNVPASSIPTSAMAAIDSYVRDLGGGLVVVGGDKAYGAGGYAQTPLEDALPLSSTVNPRKNLPSTAVVFVIESLESNLGVDISKEAAKAAMQSLTSLDEVGVLDGNDGSGMWVVPLQPLTDKAAVSAKIDTMQPGDPSSYMPFFTAAHDALAKSQARTKHIILLGDGDATDNYEPAVRAIAKDGITISVVGTNVAPSDLALLQSLADWGGGRYYDGNDPFDIPQILTRETQFIARPAIVEDAFKPAVVGGSPIMQGIAPNSLPALRGYIATTAKPTAQVVMASNQADPILAEWQYGLGRVVAWTSDAKGQWATDWLAWPDFANFWSQVIRRTLPAQVDLNTQTTVQAKGAQADVTVDSMTPDHAFRDFLTTKATIFDPSGKRTQINLDQTAPGRYQGSFPADAEGTYLVQVMQSDAQGNVVANQTTGYVVPYSPEYRELQTNTGLLGQLAATTGGKALSAPAQAFSHDIAQAEGSIDLATWLLALALVGFLFDVGVRRLRVSLGEVAVWWRRLTRTAPGAGPETAAARSFRTLRERLADVRAAATAAGAAAHPSAAGAAASSAAPAQSTFARVSAARTSARLEQRDRAPAVTARGGVAEQRRAPIPEPSSMGHPAQSPPPRPQAAERPQAPPPPRPRPRPAPAARASQPPTSKLLEAKERARRRTGV